MVSKIKKAVKIIAITLSIVLLLSGTLFALNIYLQKYYAHRKTPFVPEYERVILTEETDYETVFLQTGLGKSVVDKLKEAGQFKKITEAQEIFFTEPNVECNQMLGLFTMEDRLDDSDSTPFYDLRLGDILLTFSTHSLGWRHGHAALVTGKNVVLECESIGTLSSESGIYYWKNYSNYVVLRPKGITPELGEKVVDYSLEELIGLPYKLTSGIFGSKEIDLESRNAGFYCTNLIWYAWKHFGIDLDSDGGKIVTSTDLLNSDKLEVIQIYGLNPESFVDRIG